MTRNSLEKDIYSNIYDTRFITYILKFDKNMETGFLLNSKHNLGKHFTLKAWNEKEDTSCYDQRISIIDKIDNSYKIIILIGKEKSGKTFLINEWKMLYPNMYMEVSFDKVSIQDILQNAFVLRDDIKNVASECFFKDKTLIIKTNDFNLNCIPKYIRKKSAIISLV